MGGIACGIRRKILIFNTSENLLHDPISVVDPECYDSRIKIDTETPVVVVYNNYHYENLLPVDEQDRQETIRLVDSYIKDRYKEEYGFTKKDITYLISPSPRNTRQGIKCPQQDSAKSNTNSKLRAMYPGKIKQSKQSYNLVNQEVQNKKSKFESEGLEEQEKQPWTTVFSKQNQERKVENSQKNKQKTTCQPKIKKKSEEKLNSTNNQEKCLKGETDKKIQSDAKLKNPVVEKECFKWGHVMFEEMENKKIKCGFCQSECLRLISHLNGSSKCSHGINMVEFKFFYNKYNQRKRIKKSEQKRKADDQEGFNENISKRVKKCEQKKKAENPDKFKEDKNDRTKKYEQQKKAKNPDKFKEEQHDRKKKSEQQKKAEDPDKFKENLRERKVKSRNMVNANDRLLKFRKKIQYGPIFVCTSCHQKLFINQVEELTNKLKEEINKVDKDIRA